MKNNYETLKLLMDEVKAASILVEDACIKFGETKARLQLEIYRLVKEENITEEHMTNMIDAISSDIDNKAEQSARQSKTLKFFREQDK